MTEPLVQVDNLVVHYPVYKGILRRQVGTVKAVDGISLDLGRGETLALVGESGCGKTTAGQAILRLQDPDAGAVMFRGVDLVTLQGDALRAMRRHMQVIFQDPYSSLNPRQTVGKIISAPMVLHGLATQRDADDHAKQLLEKVGLQASYVSRYPHEFSGGQRQRIGIARAIAVKPDFIVCDEAVSALDVSVQAQVINLLVALKDELGLSYIFIAHDLSVVRHIADHVAVMYLGKIVEYAPAADLFASPQHPYTQALLSAVPNPHPRKKKQRIILAGDVPSPMNPPPGCRFHTRCPIAELRCEREVPAPHGAGAVHVVSCHLAAEGRAHLAPADGDADGNARTAGAASAETSP